MICMLYALVLIMPNHTLNLAFILTFNLSKFDYSTLSKKAIVGVGILLHQNRPLTYVFDRTAS